LRPAPWRVTLDGILVDVTMPSEPERGLLRFESQRGSLTALMLIDRDAISALLEAAMGGTGAEPAFEMHERPLSNIERRIMNLAQATIAEQLALALSETLGRTFSLFDGREAPEMARGLQFAQFRYIVNIFTHSGEISLIFLQNELEEQIAQDNLDQGREVAVQERIRLQEEVGRSEIKFAITLGQETLTVDDIAGMRPGTLINLTATASSPVIVWSGDVAAYEATLGRNGDKLAITIASAIT